MEAFAGIEGGVRQSIARIQASPFAPRKDRVRGLVYDCATDRWRVAHAAWSGASGRHSQGAIKQPLFVASSPRANGPPP